MVCKYFPIHGSHCKVEFQYTMSVPIANQCNNPRPRLQTKILLTIYDYTSIDSNCTESNENNYWLFWWIHQQEAEDGQF